MSCPPFWMEDPRILMDGASEFFPFTEHDRRCTAAALNSFTRFGIYLGLLFAIVRLEVGWLIVGVLFAIFAAGAWKYMEHFGTIHEGFYPDRMFDTKAPILDPRDVINEYVPDVIGAPADRTHPTAANPFMNILMTEIGDNPYRGPAESVMGANVRKELDSYFQTMFASDPGDVFNHTQNQRNWVTMPSTTIPNDQGSFADWLYRVPGQTYKEGNLLASGHVNTGCPDLLPWRSLSRAT